jgi:lipopolysaccharide transport system permease protein
VLPIVALLSAIVHSFVGVGILIVGVVAITGTLSPLALLLPLAYVPLLLLCLAAGWFLTSLGVYVRDIGQGMPVFVQFVMFMSAVVYPVSAVPARLQPVLQLNPLTSILEQFRDLLLWGHVPSVIVWLCWTAGTALMAWLGYVWFMKTKKGFADVL